LEGDATNWPGPERYGARSVRGREAFKHLFAAYLAASDFHSMPEFLMTEGDMVVVRKTHRLKYKGEFQGIPLTGKEVSVTGCLGYVLYLFQNQEVNDHAGKLITIRLMQE
jgi:predicted ester cyclase